MNRKHIFPGAETATKAVVQIGKRKGRGFIIGDEDYRCIITAAHCLPRSRYPKPHLANGVNELTFSNIAGPLGAKRGTIWAELMISTGNEGAGNNQCPSLMDCLPPWLVRKMI
jgi:hypothetical protein